MPTRPSNLTGAAVLAAWAGMTALAAGFVAGHGHNLPVNDEWAFVPVLYADRPAQLHFLTEPHGEHRYPLARALYLGLHDMTGHDFRAGMWVSLGLLSGSALLLIGAARALRGRAALLDCWFPVLLLHPGHAENLLLGYQIALTVTIVSLALALRVAAGVECPGRRAAIGGAALVAVSLGGGIGWVFTPFLGGWVAFEALRCAGRPGVTAKLAAAGLLVPVLAAGGYMAWSATMVSRAEPIAVRNDLAGTLTHATEAVGLALGPAAQTDPPVWGWVVFAAELAAGLWLAAVALRRPAERPAALGMLAVLLGVWAFALTVGHTRPSGWPPRYAAVSALGPCVALLAFAQYGSPRLGRWLGVAGLVAAVPLVLENREQGKWYALPYDLRYRAVIADVEAGVPIGVFAQRHAYYWHPQTAEVWQLLWEHGHPSVRGLPATPAYRVIPVAVTPGGPPLALEFGPPRTVAAVRVRFRSAELRYWQQFRLSWAGPGGERTSFAVPWVRADDGVTAFWVNDRAGGARLEWDPAPGVEITAVELLIQADGPP